MFIQPIYYTKVYGGVVHVAYPKWVRHRRNTEQHRRNSRGGAADPVHELRRRRSYYRKQDLNNAWDFGMLLAQSINYLMLFRFSILVPLSTASVKADLHFGSQILKAINFAVWRKVSKHFGGLLAILASRLLLA